MRRKEGDAGATPTKLCSGSGAAVAARPLIIATCPVRWRLLLTPPLSGPENMALDVALMARARRTGEAVARVYGWSTPTLSFGRNERAVERFDAAAIAGAGLEVVRRPTGGRALLHHRELTYSVTAPAGDSLVASCRRITAHLINALEQLGVPATVAAAGGRHAPTAQGPCFAEPSAGELVVAGRKLAGSAQWRHDGALLQHGSILIDDDQSAIAALRRERAMLPVAAPPPPATLRALLGRPPSTEEFAGAWFHAIRESEDPGAEEWAAEPEVLREARALGDSFRAPDWTWRR